MRDDGLRGGSAGASGVPVPFSPTRTAFRTAPGRLCKRPDAVGAAGWLTLRAGSSPAGPGRPPGATSSAQPPPGQFSAGAAGPRRQVREDLVDGPARRAERPLRARRRLSRSRPVTPAAPRRSITHGSSLHASKIRRVSVAACNADDTVAGPALRRAVRGGPGSGSPIAERTTRAPRQSIREGAGRTLTVLRLG